MITGGVTAFLMSLRSFLMSLRSWPGPGAGLVGEPGLAGEGSSVPQPATRASANAMLETLDQGLIRDFTSMEGLPELRSGGPTRPSSPRFYQKARTRA